MPAARPGCFHISNASGQSARIPATPITICAADAGSFYWDETCPDDFETPEAAAEWARTQTQWEDGAELDFSDGVTSGIVLGREVGAADVAWQRWADGGGAGPYPDVAVRNYAVELGLVRDDTVGSP